MCERGNGVRILFTFVGGTGHCEPLLPVARAAAGAGHTVAFACRPSMVPLVRTGGFAAFAAGPDVPDLPDIAPLLAADPEREEQVLRHGFARRTAHERTRDILELSAKLRPDMVVSDEVDYGAIIAAERLELPHASVLVLAAGSFARPEVIAEPLNEVRAAYGLPPDPALEMLSRYLVLVPFPPSFRDPGFPLPATAYPIRPAALEAPLHTPPRLRPDAFAGGPTVYFTLGTIFNMESGDLFTRVLAGLRALPVNVIATLGRQLDPERFGPQPANVHIERFVPQSLVLPGCDLVISHGGSGSVVGALAYGLPSLLLPMGADQPHNARRCEQLGVARVLDSREATPDDIQGAVASLLADPRYRQRASQLRAEIAALPHPRAAVALLERLSEHK